MPISQMYAHSKGWIGKDLHTLCKYKTFFMRDTASFSKQGQDFGTITSSCHAQMLLLPPPRQVSPTKRTSFKPFLWSRRFFWVRRGKNRFKAPFAAVLADCHSWLWKGGGLGGHTQPVAAVHIFLGHSSRVRDKSLYSQPCLKWPCATS